MGDILFYDYCFLRISSSILFLLVELILILRSIIYLIPFFVHWQCFPRFASQYCITKHLNKGFHKKESIKREYLFYCLYMDAVRYSMMPFILFFLCAMLMYVVFLRMSSSVTRGHSTLLYHSSSLLINLDEFSKQHCNNVESALRVFSFLPHRITPMSSGVSAEKSLWAFNSIDLY